MSCSQTALKSNLYSWEIILKAYEFHLVSVQKSTQEQNDKNTADAK